MSNARLTHSEYLKAADALRGMAKYNKIDQNATELSPVLTELVGKKVAPDTVSRVAKDLEITLKHQHAVRKNGAAPELSDEILSIVRVMGDRLDRMEAKLDALLGDDS